ncbi:MAG: DeoR family transcriptional regulator, partial [Clostridia bacterium]
MKATERRQAILEELCVRRFEKVENLAFEFDVSDRTIRTDIQELSLSYPIYTKQGKYDGGVYVTNDYFLGKQYLKPSQQKLLEKLISFSTGDDLRTLQSILQQ